MPGLTATDRILADLPTHTLIQRVLVWQVIGLLLMAFHILLSRESIWLFPLVPLILGWLYLNAPLAGILVFFQILIYQNWMISIFSPGMEYQPTYVTLQGTNFVVLCVIATIALHRLMAPVWWYHLRPVILMILATLAMFFLWSVFGAVKSSPTSAAVYFRNFASPMFAVLVGLDIGRAWGVKTIGTAFMFTCVLCIVLSLVEYTIPLDYYDWVHQVRYYQLKYTMQPESNVFYVPKDIVDHFTNVFLNISGLTANESAMMTFRFGGSIITPTSYAYILGVLGVVAVSVYRSSWLIVIVPLMFLIGAKGAGLLLIFSVVIWMVWRVTRSKRMTLISGIVISVFYVASGIIIGLGNNDYHVIGFLGGVHSLAGNPLGHGVGVGGNMSAEANAGFKMDGPGGFTRLGADFALESAVGVLFFQIGFASLLVFAVFLVMVYVAPIGELRGNRLIPLRRDILLFAVAMIMVNGVFQEEAYSPYAAGMVMLFCGCLIGNGRRQTVIYSPSAHQGFGYKVPA